MEAHENRLSSQFLIVWIGQFISSIGSGLTYFALGIYVLEKTHSVTSFTMILLCIFLPSLLLKPFGGILADRFDRKLMIFLGDLGAGLGVAFIFLMMVCGVDGLWYIYLGIIISSAFGSIQEPAYKASVTDFLPKEHYAKASGLMQLVSAAQYLISPFLAGILLTLSNITLIFIIDIGTFIFANVTVLWVRKVIGKTKSRQSHAKFTVDLKDGIREFSKNKGILWLVGITMIILFFVGLLQSLFIPMLLSITDAKNAGIIQSICAIGMLIGSMIIGIFGKKKNHTKTLSLSLFVAGLFFAAIGFSTELIAITVMGFLFFCTLPFINTSIEVLIRKNIDNQKQGRVWSIISIVTYFGSIVAFTSAGFLADLVFNPLLNSDSGLANFIGAIIGTGEGRGIGLMFVISGILISIIASTAFHNKFIKNLES
jgi:MFS transporter, DHA3 family, macrolide efflux protein